MKMVYLVRIILCSLVMVLVFCSVIAEELVTGCSRVCGKDYSIDHLPFFFGFSSGCEIQLNCTSNGTMAIHDFAIHSVSSDSILVNLPQDCGRPMQSVKHLFSSNYAPTSNNGILLQKCNSTNVGNCVIPTTEVQTSFALRECGNDTMSCYYEKNNQSLFMDYHNLSSSTCKSFVSAISVETLGNKKDSAVSLDVQLVQLGWWLQGDCKCSKHSNCTEIHSPLDGKPGYQCRCLEGYTGDGYNDGLGCWKESTSCSPSKYMSGHCGGHTRIGVLVGGVAAGASLMITLGLLCCYIHRKRIQRNRNKSKNQLYETSGITIPIYSYREIEKATNIFSEKRKLGIGAYGTVYSGRLNSDEWVAIKRIKQREIESTDQVINEIRLLSSVEHPNLVRLLGCSIEKNEQILIYEFMPNGTLSQHLRRERGHGLPWPVRVTIAAETAQAIAYLHNAMHPPIFHRDIKSSNILLDNNYKSKVADFGLSRLGSMIESSHISTAPQGTPGYLDPQYHQDFHLSDKSDVYSFGVVLVEIISALKVVDFSRSYNEIKLAALAVDKIGKGCLDEIIDPFLEPFKDSWTTSSLQKVAELAFRCLAFHRDMRPSMMEVAIELEQIRLSQWPNNSDASITYFSGKPPLSSSSNASELPLKIIENEDTFDRKDSMDNAKEFSPESTKDSWFSDPSSPSLSSLLGHPNK